MTSRHIPISCRTCGERLDAATGVKDADPKPGDLSICFYCGEASIFVDSMTLRATTPEERATIEQNESLQDLIAHIKTFAQQRKSH